MLKTAIRSKLKQAVDGLDISDFSDEALIDILVNKIDALERTQKADRDFAEAAIAFRDDQIRNLKEMIKETRENPLAMASGSYFFVQQDKYYISVHISAGKYISIQAHNKKDKNAVLPMQLTREQFFAELAK